MSKTLNTKPFDIYSSEKDVTVLRDFTGDKDQIAYKRTAPKRVGTFPGMQKTEMKHTNLAADGSVVSIVTVTTSIRADAIDAAKDDIMLTFKAAVADGAWSTLVLDQRLPLTI